MDFYKQQNKTNKQKKKTWTQVRQQMSVAMSFAVWLLLPLESRVLKKCSVKMKHHPNLKKKKHTFSWLQDEEQAVVFRICHFRNHLCFLQETERKSYNWGEKAASA